MNFICKLTCWHKCFQLGKHKKRKISFQIRCDSMIIFTSIISMPIYSSYENQKQIFCVAYMPVITLIFCASNTRTYGYRNIFLITLCCLDIISQSKWFHFSVTWSIPHFQKNQRTKSRRKYYSNRITDMLKLEYWMLEKFVWVACSSMLLCLCMYLYNNV